MRRANVRSILFSGIIVFFASSTVFADCFPERVLKIVTAAEYPDTPPDAFVAQPRMLYRLGERYGRIEEPYSPQDNVQHLVIISEPDLWMVNLVDMTGQHMVDPGPTFIFRAPVFDSLESAFWRRFEFGCEEAFMKAAGARTEAMADGAVKYTHVAEGTTVSLIVANGKPQRVEVAKPNQKFAVRYVSFEVLSTTSTERFQRPDKVQFRETEPKKQ